MGYVHHARYMIQVDSSAHADKRQGNAGLWCLTNTRGDLDLTRLPVLVRIAVPPANASSAPSSLADRVDAHILELEVVPLASIHLDVLALPVRLVFLCIRCQDLLLTY